MICATSKKIFIANVCNTLFLRPRSKKMRYYGLNNNSQNDRIPIDISYRLEILISNVSHQADGLM